jgi:hypothetical protein
MDYQNHSPSISIVFGSASGIGAFLVDHGAIENVVQLIKVILFAFIGGVVGYVGKIVAIKIHHFLKK